MSDEAKVQNQAEVFAVLAAIQATTQLVEQAFRIVDRLRKAHSRQKALADVLTRHRSELESIKAIIGIIDDEEDLQIPTVATELVRLQGVQVRLAELLENLDPKMTSKMNQIARQLTSGSADEKKLGDIMDELVQVKTMLVLRIQVAHVGVIRTIGKEAVVNAEAIQRIDEYLREHVHNCEGLKIAKLLKGRRPSNDGTVPLTLADLKALNNEANGEGEDSGDETLVDDSETSPRDLPVKTERIITRNIARNQALQINAAVIEDLWKDVNHLKIHDNVAEDESTQVNYAMNREVFSMLFEQRNKVVAAPRQRTAVRAKRAS
ncbi:unnamed protein product [Alternaria alternata]|uniref:Fungal N-terminal domain-containing protein n=1 Tax=Alternaria tenuissima TaxID=119927 RepID=A0A4Q4M7R7_9PLEO|nr:hypothetical protein CUC08_Gglean008916 [Alternaria sp. MG1]RYN45245.1 hypothetical protein AA0114_g9234 [Alternaria tenuissima]